MSIPLSPETSTLLDEYRKHLVSAKSKAAFDLFVKSAHDDPRYDFVPEPHGVIQRVVRYLVDGKYVYAFIVNKSGLLFYYRKPCGRVDSDLVKSLIGKGLNAGFASKGKNLNEITVMVTTVEDAEKVLEDCFGDNFDRLKLGISATQWSDEELKASVEAYLGMLHSHRSGTPYVKAPVYRELASRFGRTDSAFERRMMNISSVLSILGREWLPGLLPAKNVGTNIAPRIERLIAEVEGKQAIPVVQFEADVLENLERPSMERPEGCTAPKKSTTPVTSFARDPAVKAWVLRRANGKCESCLEDAPFVTTEGYPFLEVHHLKTLADGGSDRVSNAVALCPNCHRRFHHGGDKAKLRDKLYMRIDRLISE